MINWLRTEPYFRFVVFGFNSSATLSGGGDRDWWAHRTPDHTQRFFCTLEEAENWIKENHGLRGFGRDNSKQAQGELFARKIPSTYENEVWLGCLKLIQENFDYGELVKWYGSSYEYDEGKYMMDKANWWIFHLKD